MAKKILFLIYSDKKHKLVSPIGPFETEPEAQSYDAAVRHIAGDWMNLEGSAWGVELTHITGTREANELAASIQRTKFPRFEIQDDPTDPREFHRPLNPPPRITVNKRLRKAAK